MLNLTEFRIRLQLQLEVNMRVDHGRLEKGLLVLVNHVFFCIIQRLLGETLHAQFYKDSLRILYYAVRYFFVDICLPVHVLDGNMKAVDFISIIASQLHQSMTLVFLNRNGIFQ